LASGFQTLDALQRADRATLNEVAEVGPRVAASVEGFFKQDENREVLQQLVEAGLESGEIPQAEGEPSLSGKTFVFTGTLEKHTRAEAQRLVESLGGRATSSVSGETDYVVVGANPGSKLDEAKKHRVETLDEEAFDKLLSRQS
jgi:DNA ligase (NAD+)